MNSFTEASWGLWPSWSQYVWRAALSNVSVFGGYVAQSKVFSMCAGSMNLCLLIW